MNQKNLRQMGEDGLAEFIFAGQVMKVWLRCGPAPEPKLTY